MLRKHRKTVLYLAVLIIPFLIVLFKPRSLNAIALLDAGAGPAGFFKSAAQEFKKFFFYRDTYDAYLFLKKQNDVLKADAVALREALARAGIAADIARFRRNQNYPSLVADVVGRDPSSWNASLVLDKGASEGVKIGMPVVSPLGVVGRVAEVGRNTSKVILLADPNFAVAGLVARSRESGLVTGTLQGSCRLEYLTDNADVKVGDQVVTSKLSSGFPDGILIGRVVDVQAGTSSRSVECLVEPAVNLSQLEQVVIIKR